MKKAQAIFKLDPDNTLQNVAVTCIIFGFHEDRIKVLLSRFDGFDKWLLPIGFVSKKEDVRVTAKRIVEDATGSSDATLRQFAFFGSCARVNPSERKKLLKTIGIHQTDDKVGWFSERSIALSYFTLVRHADITIQSLGSNYTAEWFDINDLPVLFADYGEIIAKAKGSIRNQMGSIPLGYELLPIKFTMPELRIIYEAFMEREIDRRNFQRKMLSIGCIEPLNETRKIGARRSPHLYCFLKEKYEHAAKMGTQLVPWSIFKETNTL